MTEIAHQPCPHCDSTDAFSYNTNGYGKCFSCGTGYPAKGKRYSEEVLAKYPLKERNNDMNYVPKNIRPATSLQNGNGNFVAERGISQQTMEFYGSRLTQMLMVL